MPSGEVSRRPVGRSRWLGTASLLLVLACLLSIGCTQREAIEERVKAPVEARADIDRAVATTGDVMTYTVTVDYDAGYEIDLPEPGAEIAGFRIIDMGREKPRQAGGRIVEARWYKLRADLVGSYVLPAVSVSYRPVSEDTAPGGSEIAAESVETSEIFVEVESVLPADGEVTDIRDIKPLRRVKTGPSWWLIAAASVVLISALALGAHFLWRRRRQLAESPPPPAHEIAFRALDALRQIDFNDLLEVRRYYFRISEVIRTYVEGRFGLNATDLTTEEILEGAELLQDLQATESDRLGRFLIGTDQVKFAAHVPSESEIQETYEQALSFVEATQAAEAPVEAGA